MQTPDNARHRQVNTRRLKAELSDVFDLLDRRQLTGTAPNLVDNLLSESSLELE